MRKNTLLAIVALLTLATSSTARADEIPWVKDIEQAKQIAAQSNRLVLLHFWTPTCPPCLRLARDVYSQKGVGAAISAKYVPVKINAAEDIATRKKYDVHRWPTDVIIDPAGNVLAKQSCPASRSTYLAGLDRAAKYLPNTQLAQDNSTPESSAMKQRNAYRQVIATSSTAPTGPIMPNTDRYATYFENPDRRPAPQVPPTQQAPPTQQPAPRYIEAKPAPKREYQPAPAPYTPTPKATAQTAPPRYNPAPYKPTPNYQTPEAANAKYQPAPYSNPNAISAQHPQAQRPQTQLQPFASYLGGEAQSPQPSPKAIANVNPVPPANNGIAPKSIYPQQQAPTQPRLQQPQPRQPQVAHPPAQPRMRSLAITPGAAPAPPQPGINPQSQRTMPPPPAKFGLHRHCPVTLSERQQWALGNPQWGAVHRGHTYLFASQESQQKFLARPDAYAPALSGHDPVMATVYGQMVPGSRDYGLFGDDYTGRRIYLFSSEETLKEFERNPDRYSQAVRQAESTPQGPVR